MDSGSGFVEVSTSPLLISPVIISNADVVSGKFLDFRYRAYNVHGWSSYSSEVQVVAATVPDTPTLPQTIVTEFDSRVTFIWSAPTNTGGDAIPITGYSIEVQHYDGVTYTVAPSSDCDGLA
jgi:hypothetical protein